MNLQEMIDNALIKMNDEGTIEKKVNEAVSSLVDSTLKSVLGRYGTFEKQLEKHLEENLKLSLDKINLPLYTQAVIDAIDPMLRVSVLEQNIDKIKQRVFDVTGIIEVKSVKLSEIVDSFIKSIAEKDDSEEGDVTVEIRHSSWGSTYIYMDEESGKNERDCKYRMSINNRRGDGLLWLLEIEGKPTNIINNVFDYTHGFDGYLFNLYANGVVIEIDEFETSWSKYND